MTSPKPFAHGTEVTVEKSRAELEALLAKHGATQRPVMVDDDAGEARVGFIVAGRKYVLTIPLPPKGRDRRYEQSCRERWRAVVLTVKAKLELARMGASTIEREFLADLVLPNGETAGATIGSYIAKVIAEGYRAPLALPEARP